MNFTKYLSNFTCDVILASKGTDATKEIGQLVPELKEVKECDSVDATEGMQSSGFDAIDATDWMQPRGCHSDDLHIPLGPMTRSKQARLQQALTNSYTLSRAV